MTSRQENQLSFISQYVDEIKHISGCENSVADALSRCLSTVKVGAIEGTTINFENLKNEQGNDTNLGYLTKKYPERWRTFSCGEGKHNIICDISNGFIRPYLPSSVRYTIFKQFHKLSHSGPKACAKMISQRYVWFGMKNEIRKWCKECQDCQASKITRHVKAPFDQIPSPDRFHTVHIDLVGPLPSSNGYRYLLTMIDRYTKWPEAIPLRGITAKLVADKFIENWVSRFGVPTCIISDRGAQFESELWRNLMQNFGIDWHHTTAYHPQANGAVERFHRDLKNAIKAHAENNKDWAKSVPLILLGIRNSCTEMDKTPAQMTYGKMLCLPGDYFSNIPLQKTTYEELQSAIKSFKPPQRKTRQSTKFYIPKEMGTCKKVWLRKENTKGLERPYEGPYNVIEKRKKYFKIYKDSKNQNISIDRLKPFIFYEGEE